MEFDYIIVAAGSAGCVLANRLTANGRFSVASGVIASPQLLMVSGICSPRKLAHARHFADSRIGRRRRRLTGSLAGPPGLSLHGANYNTEVGNIFWQAMIGFRYVTIRKGPMTMAASLGTGFFENASGP